MLCDLTCFRSRFSCATMAAAEVDVVIVGAGLSGLYAASQLSDRGFTVRVLEARDRVGGRTFSPVAHGRAHDMGAGWIGPSQERCYALVKRFGLQTFKTLDTGRNVQYIGGQRSEYRGTIPPLNLMALIDLYQSMKRVNWAAASIPAGAPWEHPDALSLDSMTVHSYMNSVLWTAQAKLALDIGVRMILGAESNQVSALYFLTYIKQAGTLERLISCTDGAQQERIVGGTQQFSTLLAAELTKKAPGSVVLEAPVRAIEQADGLVRVHHAKGTVLARYAIIAIPPTLASRIHYSPMLPTSRDALAASVPMGRAIKVVVIYRKPWWRNRGFSGQLVSDVGPISGTFDDCSPDLSTCALLGFITGRDVLWWSAQPLEVRKKAVLDQYAYFWQTAEAREPLHYEELDWTREEWSRGCYVGIVPPGILTQVGRALRAPCGLIHFAGTESAQQWVGYMEGACEAGERAAKEIIDRSQKTAKL